ncbi:MAG: hypothetical protein LBS53_09245 [Synergistaceae bacterium]|jgi:hypothetical protein|nr:hypothetical protein [Synergistaceae bacterium]
MSCTQLSVEAILRALEVSLPPIFTRREIPALTGKLLAVGTLANLGEQGPPFCRTKRHAVYEKSSFLTWLAGYLGKSTKNIKKTA